VPGDFGGHRLAEVPFVISLQIMVIKSAVVHKRAVSAKKYKNWRKRRLVLQSDRLEWYREVEEWRSGSSPAGVIQLTPSSIVEQWAGGRPHCICVREAHLELIFQSDNPDECAAWIASIGAALWSLRLNEKFEKSLRMQDTNLSIRLSPRTSALSLSPRGSTGSKRDLSDGTDQEGDGDEGRPSSPQRALRSVKEGGAVL